MKRRWLILIAVLALCGVSAYGQGIPGAMGNPAVAARAGGKFIAAAAGTWQGRVISGNSSSGTATIIVAPGAGGTGMFQLGDGTSLPPSVVFATLTPVIVDWGQAAQETVTPTAVSVSTCPSGNIGIGGVIQCVSVTGTFANTHGQSAVVIDGTYGLQTAINMAAAYAGASSPNGAAGGVAVIDAAWAQYSGCFSLTCAPLAGTVAYGGVVIEDLRGPGIGYFAPRASSNSSTGTASAPTLTAVSCPGGLPGFASNAFYAKIEYVDVNGEVSVPSSETAQVATSSALPCMSLTALPASAGQVGEVVYLTQPGGGSGNEIGYPLTPGTNVSGCVLTRVEAVTNACVVTNAAYGQSGATITLGAPGPSGQSKTVGVSDTTNRTAFAYQYVGNSPPNAVAAVFTQAGTATAAGTYQIASLNVPANYLNFVGAKRRLCFTGHDTFGGTAGQTLQFILFYGPYNNGDVQLLNFGASGSGSGTSGQQSVNACIDLVTTASGSSGTIQAHGVLHINLANGNADSPIADQAGPAAALLLSSQQQLRVQMTVGSASLGAGFVLDSLSLEAVN